MWSSYTRDIQIQLRGAKVRPEPDATAKLDERGKRKETTVGA